MGQGVPQRNREADEGARMFRGVEPATPGAVKLGTACPMGLGPREVSSRRGAGGHVGPEVAVPRLPLPVAGRTCARWGVPTAPRGPAQKYGHARDSWARGEHPSCVSSEPPRAQAQKGRCARGQESPDAPPGCWGGDGAPACVRVRGGKCHHVLSLDEWTAGGRRIFL